MFNFWDWAPKRQNVNLPNFISQEMPMTRKNLEIARKIF
jgi:hypothetical protein